MKYTTKTKLVLPEYGRNIQQMVQHACELENRDDRNRCARTIISIMANLYPENKGTEGFAHKLWDQLAMMSNFTLDVDYPFTINKPEDVDLTAERVAFAHQAEADYIRFKHYGVNMQNFIRIMAEHPELDTTGRLIVMLANQMKKLYLEWNKDSVDDRKIFDDIYILSDHRIQIDPRKVKLDDDKPYRKGPNNKNNNNKKNK